MQNMPLGYFDVVIGYFIYNNMAYLPEIILFILQFIGIRKYTIFGDKDKYKRIMKQLHKETYSSKRRYTNGKETPSGYFIGKNCVGYFENSSKYIDEEHIVIITTEQYFKILEKDSPTQFTQKKLEPDSEKEEENVNLLNKEPVKEKELTHINVFMRSGTYKSFYYSSLSLDVSHIKPINGQGEIMNEIIKIYNEKSRASIFIHGVSCAGKSSIGYLVAKAIKGNFCHTFNPSDPGDNFSHMIREINSRNDEETLPLVIVIEEANEMIKNIHDKKNIKIHQEIPTSIHDKSSWCNFLDDMIFYKNVVLILTSNVSKQSIDELDPAFLRPGRINATFSMMKPIEIMNELQNEVLI